MNMFQQVLINHRGIGKFKAFTDYVKLELETNGTVTIFCNSIDTIKKLRDLIPFRFYFFPISDIEGECINNIYKLICVSEEKIKRGGRRVAIICPNHKVYYEFIKHVCFDEQDMNIYHPVMSVKDTRGYRFHSFIICAFPHLKFSEDINTLIGATQACLV